MSFTNTAFPSSWIFLFCPLIFTSQEFWLLWPSAALLVLTEIWGYVQSNHYDQGCLSILGKTHGKTGNCKSKNSLKFTIQFPACDWPTNKHVLFLNCTWSTSVLALVPKNTHRFISDVSIIHYQQEKERQGKRKNECCFKAIKFRFLTFSDFLLFVHHRRVASWGHPFSLSKNISIFQRPSCNYVHLLKQYGHNEKFCFSK